MSRDETFSVGAQARDARSGSESERPWVARGLCVWVALLFLGIYLLTAGNGFYWTDGDTMVRVTWAMVDRHRLAIPCDPGLPSAVAGRDGRCYSRYGLGQPLAAVPLYLGGQAAVALLPSLDYGEAIRFAVSRLNQIITAILCGVVCALAMRLYRSRPVALLLSLLFGLSTLALPYARFYFNEPLTALMLLLSVYALIVFNDEGRPYALLWGGLAFGYAVLTRTTVVVLLPLWLAYLAWPTGARRSIRQWALFIAPIAVLGAVQAVYQAWAFGSPVAGGYGGEGWQTPLLAGLYGLLLSPGKSLLLFVPLTLLAPWGWVRLAACRRREAALFAAASIVWLLVHAGWWTWHGGWSWGPRFLVTIMPFLILPLGVLWIEARREVRWLILALAALGFAIELGGVAINFGDYMMLINDEDKVLFNAAFSPAWGHWRMLLGGIAPDLALLHFTGAAQAAWAVLAGLLIGVGAWRAGRLSRERI